MPCPYKSWSAFGVQIWKSSLRTRSNLPARGIAVSAGKDRRETGSGWCAGCSRLLQGRKAARRLFSGRFFFGGV